MNLKKETFMTDIQKTKKLGRYEIHSTLGKGGMATVYKAMDSFLQRTIALKVASISTLDMATPDKNKLAQCLKEARLAAQFIHPNIVITYDAGIKEDLFYIALEYIDGKGLQTYAGDQGGLSRSQVLEIVYNTCYALDYIHKKGYVHLDIKPSNIMLTRRDEVKLMDFGISRILRGNEENNKSSSFQGTPLYMSPEQAGSGETVDQQSDIFSLGVVMYELLTGKKPFLGKSVAELIHRISRVEPVPISRHLPDVSLDIEQIVLRAMGKKKSDRYKTTLDLAEALLPFIKGKDSVQLDKQDKKKIEYLKRLPFFKHFQYSELMEVIRISSWSFKDRQTKITREDENDNTIYFLVQGRASLHIRGAIKVLEPGECFGETAVLYKMPRKAAVIAETNCVVMAINANLLKQASEALQVKFLREFYNKKIMQLVDANLTMIRAGR
jgi:eukaryotic-like serine/threonine-protein kinase